MTMIKYAMSFIGTPYVWGGNTADEGFDCSGFVCEVLRSNGHIGSEDLTAQQIYEAFNLVGRSSGISENALVFYGESLLKITHVALAINEKQVIEAAGEGRVSTKNGMVRIRPYNYRSDLVAAIRF